MADSKRAAGKPRRPRGSSDTWTEEEKAAMRESARERRALAKLSPEEQREAGEAEVRAKLDELEGNDRVLAERIHELVMRAAPSLTPRTYYGMPAYAADGKLICFFQPSSKFKVRYATFGFQPDAKLDEGAMWPTSFAVIELTPVVEGRIMELVRKAVG